MIIQGIAKSASVFLAALVCAVAIAGVGRGASAGMTRGRKWNRNALQFLFEGGAQCAAPQEGTYAL
jgi:hypothetical protein